MKRFLFSWLIVFFILGLNNLYSSNFIKPDKVLKIEKKPLKVAIMLPLSYEKIEELDFTKYNIEEKKRGKYRCFEYITFYEGARIALEELEKEGYSVSLYVYDVGEEDINEMTRVLSLAEMKTMDLIIPLVFQKCFSLAADFGKANKISVINPMSSNYDILKDNSFVFKIQPSSVAEVETITRYIKNNFSNPNIIILFSPNNKNILDMYQRAIEKEGWSWCGIDFDKFQRRIFEKIDLSKNNIYISIVDKGNQNKNEAYANSLLAQLNNNKRLPTINLIAQYNWIDYPSIDFNLLQIYNLHFTLSYLNDYTNANFVSFVKEYRKHFRQEPDKIYAALGYDIMMFFIPSIFQKQESFINEPNIDRTKNMINPFFFDRKDKNDGWQNRRTVVYKLSDYKIMSVGR